MSKTALICGFCTSMALYAASDVDVFVCQIVPVPEAVIARAEIEAAGVFRSSGVDVAWRECPDGLRTQEMPGQHQFTIWIESELPLAHRGSLRRDPMGRANVAADTADLYYATIQSTAEARGVDIGVLLGYVIVHELGHLLLGPGHDANGIMTAQWTLDDLQAIRQRGLKFNHTQVAAIRSALHSAGRDPWLDRHPIGSAQAFK